MRRVGLAAALLLALSAAAGADGLDRAIGKAVFDRLWVPAPSSTRGADGLGPLFVARSCAACHPGGARAAFAPGQDGAVAEPGLVVRLGDEAGAPNAVYGRELQTHASAGPPEGEPRVLWRTLKAAVPLLEPDWRVATWGYGVPDDVRLSARVAPALHGAGLLDRVPEETILAAADPDDVDGDGISGRPHWIAGPDGRLRLGRFGWKATEASLGDQVASAFSLDLGLSTARLREAAGDCTAMQQACQAVPHGTDASGAEVPDSLLRPLVRFVAALRPSPSAEDARGLNLFAAVGCASCHRTEMPLSGGAVIRPFSDLLLHDLGFGLDDGLPEGAAASGEWRTPPLWGLSAALARGAGLLHDGRARTVEEAVLWHGGEAAAARDRFEALPAADRKRLLAFVGGL